MVLNSSRGSLGTVSDAGNGTYTATLTSSASTGTASITGTLGGTAIGTPTSVAFVPGAANAAHSVITTVAGSLIANGASTTTVTLQLKDANDNNLTAGSGTIVLTTDAGSVGTVTNNGDGTYTATFTAPVLAGTAHITGTLNGTAIGNPATVTLTPGPVSASHSTVIASSGSASTDTGNTVTVTVTVLDANDNPIQGSHVVLDQGATSSSISPAPVTGADTAANGVATFTVSDTTAESVVYSATASGTLLNQTAAVLYQPGTATQLVYGQQPTNAVAAATVAPPVTVRILDAHGNLTSSNASVTLGIKAGTGTAGAALAGTSTRTASSGIATFNDLSIAKSGTAYRLTATATSLASADSATFDIAPGSAAAAHSTLTRAPASVTADGSSASTLTVHAKDVNDNNLTSGGATVVFHTDLGTLSSVTDNGNGTYTATLTSTTAGTAHVDATLGGVAVANTVTVGFSAGSVPNAGQSVISGAPASLAAGATSTITVQAKDVNGNNLTSGGATVVLATDHGTLGSVTDNSDGTYTATLDASTVGVAHVTGTLNGVAIGTPATVTFTPGSADAGHTVLSASPASIVANGASTSTITVHAKDVNDNNLTSGGATVTLATSRGSLSSVTDNNDGTYTATLTSSTTAGTANITGTYNGTAIGNPTSVTLTPGAASAAHATITAGPASIVANGASTSTITVHAKDVNDNNLTSGGATVTLATSRGSLSAVTDNGDGTYTATLTSSTTAGTANITGTYNATSIGNPTSVTFTPGAANAGHTVLSASPASIVANGASTSTITVHAKDVNDNNLSTGGGTVTLATSRGSLSSVTDNGDGTYTATLTSSTTAGTASITGTYNGTAIGNPTSVTLIAGVLQPPATRRSPPARRRSSPTAPAPRRSPSTPRTSTTTTSRLGGATVTLATSRGSLSSVTDNGDGTYTATLTSSTTAGTANITGTYNGTAIGNPTSVTLTPGAADAAHTTITAGPTTIVADGATTSTITVHAKDANDNNLTSAAPPSFSHTTSGIALVGHRQRRRHLHRHAHLLDHRRHRHDHRHPERHRDHRPGDRHVRAGAIDAAHSTVVASSGTASTDAPGNTTITVTVADAHNNPIPGATVTLAANGGSSNISPVLGGTSDANGQIVFTVDDTVAQTVVYSATASGTLIVQSASVQFEPGAATHIVYLQQPTDGSRGCRDRAGSHGPDPRRPQQPDNEHRQRVGRHQERHRRRWARHSAGTTTRAAVAGVATFNDLAIAKAGHWLRVDRELGRA